MATVEERLQALEQENAALKQKIELHTIAIGGLVNKAMLESISEKNDNIFKAIEDHSRFTNAQIAELREKVEDDIEGKIVGMQTEMRQQFTAVRTDITEIRTSVTEHTKRFDHMEAMLNQILKRLPGES